MLRFLCFAALLSVAFAGQFVIQDCKTGQSEATNVKLFSPQFPDGTENPTLIKGQTYQLEIEFIASKASATLTTKIQGEINGIPLPFGGVNPNACLDLTQGRCPLQGGVLHYYKQELKVESSYPATTLFILWHLVSADGKNEVCIRLPARITN